jgi:HEAT repeat protein
MDAQEIIRMLEESTKDRRSVKHQIDELASLEELIEAVKQAKMDLTKQILCELLGNRHDDSVVDVLLPFLQDDSLGVRGEAADALARIGNTRAGKPLMDNLFIEADPGMQRALVLALGAVGYNPAIPYLIGLLGNPDETLRGCAAWSLGALKAKAAESRLLEAFETEIDEYARNRMSEALVAIRDG